MSKTLAFCLSATILVGCAGKPAAPFDTLKTANLTAYRLQNNDPTPVVAAALGAAAPGALPVIPGIDPNAIAAGVAALQKLIPPGLQIPGLSLPGTGAPGIT